MENLAPNVLLIDCPDEKGLVHKITGVLYWNDLNILRNDEFVEKTTSHFFMRTTFLGDINAEKLIGHLRNILPARAQIRLVSPQKKRIVILATKEYHALSDLLLRHLYGELNAEILAVIANHQDLQDLTQKFGIPFVMLSHQNLSREAHEQALLETLTSFQPEYLILAKYMRILSPEFTAQFPNRIINIHHSFLPAFIGANPYKQAFERGVKIIGATAHFVNEQLDQGPIIAQDVISVNHAHDWRDMAQAGKDVEKIVLSKAIKLVLNDQVFVHQNKTIIFE